MQRLRRLERDTPDGRGSVRQVVWRPVDEIKVASQKKLVSRRPFERESRTGCESARRSCEAGLWQMAPADRNKMA